MQQAEYLQIMVRLLPYVMPKATEVESTETAKHQKLSWFTDARSRHHAHPEFVTTHIFSRGKCSHPRNPQPLLWLAGAPRIRTRPVLQFTSPNC